MTRLHTTEAVAEMLSVSRRTVERWMKDGTLGYVRIPCGKRITEEHINKMLERLNKTIFVPDAGVDAGLRRHGLN